MGEIFGTPWGVCEATNPRSTTTSSTSVSTTTTTGTTTSSTTTTSNSTESAAGIPMQTVVFAAVVGVLVGAAVVFAVLRYQAGDRNQAQQADTELLGHIQMQQRSLQLRSRPTPQPTLEDSAFEDPGDGTEL